MQDHADSQVPGSVAVIPEEGQAGDDAAAATDAHHRLQRRFLKRAFLSSLPSSFLCLFLSLYFPFPLPFSTLLFSFPPFCPPFLLSNFVEDLPGTGDSDMTSLRPLRADGLVNKRLGHLDLGLLRACS